MSKTFLWENPDETFKRMMAESNATFKTELPMADMTRESFEAWANERLLDRHVRSLTNDVYENQLTQIAWQAWQAAQKDADKVIALINKRMMEAEHNIKCSEKDWRDLNILPTVKAYPAHSIPRLTRFNLDVGAYDALKSILAELEARKLYDGDKE